MLTVALIGPDGAGKTTVARRLERTLPVRVKYLYMGVNPDSSNLMLPTTRLLHACHRALGAQPDTRGPREHDAPEEQPQPGGRVRLLLGSLKRGLGMANRMAEEWFRQAAAWTYGYRGYVVLFDRHFFADYYAYDIEGTSGRRSLASRLHGFMLRRLYPQPDVVVYLDAPAEVLFARKGEGTLALLERRRQEYLSLRGLVPHFATVDATRPVEEVADEVGRLIQEFRRVRGSRKRTVRHVEG
jgi:thymidylate kinase